MLRVRLQRVQEGGKDQVWETKLTWAERQQNNR